MPFAMSAFDLLPCPLKLESILISEYKMTWELFITLIKFVWQMFFLWKILMGASKKRCWRCSSVIEIKTLTLSDLLSESTKLFDEFDKGVWSIQLHEDQSCLDIVISALSKREFMNRLCPSSRWPFIFNIHFFPGVRIRFQGCFTSLI